MDFLVHVFILIPYNIKRRSDISDICNNFLRRYVDVSERRRSVVTGSRRTSGIKNIETVLKFVEAYMGVTE